MFCIYQSVFTPDMTGFYALLALVNISEEMHSVLIFRKLACEGDSSAPQSCCSCWWSGAATQSSLLPAFSWLKFN